MEKLIIERIHPNAIIPNKAHKEDAGFDLYSVEDCVLQPGDFKSINTGIKIQLPKNTEAQIRPKSGLASNFGISVLNTPGTIDEGYTGEIGVILVNHSRIPYEVKAGKKIAQMVIKPVYQVRIEEGKINADTDRGEGKYGSTGLDNNSVQNTEKAAAKVDLVQGVFYPNMEVQYRNNHIISDSCPVQGSYYRGEALLFDMIVEDSHYEWISWISTAAGIRRFMPVRNKQSGISYGTIIRKGI